MAGGTSSAGTVGSKAGGGFSVYGAHTYRKAGIYAVTVVIMDVGGSTATANTTLNAGNGKK